MNPRRPIGLSIMVMAALAVQPAVAAARPAPARETHPAPAAAVPPYVGANAGRGTAYDPQEEWGRAQRQIGGGRLSYRRSFDPTIPAPGREAWREADAPKQFYSVKPPNHDYRGFIEGKYDDRLRAVARDLPNGTKFTMYHEPEDNMSGQDFYRMFKRMRDIVKSERPQYVQVWYVAMAYQWRTNSKGNVGSNAGWLDAAKIADGVGLDVYASKSNFKSIADDKGYQRWNELIRKPSGRPWGIVERGISPDAGEAARLDLLKKDWDFVRSGGGKFFLYWQSDHGDGTDWRLTRSGEQEYYRSMAAEGRQAGS